MKYFYLFLITITFIIGCTGTVHKRKATLIENPSLQEMSFPIPDSLRYTVQEIDNLIQMASQSLQINDSLGALAFYENAMTIFMGLSENERSLLMQDHIFKEYFEKKIKMPYSTLSEQLAVFKDDTTSTDEVQNELNNYIQKQNIEEDTLKIEEDSQFKIPHVMNKKVQLAIKYFTQTPRGRRVMERWIQRSGKYEKLIKSILKKEGVPEDLFYLAMIESGLNPRARSYARAAGIWQFIRSTGRAYGLRSGFWFDERLDVVKSTYAAAKHLKNLYQDFEDWYLALAGYNYSPRKLKRKMRYYNASEFWEIKRLPRQTRNYVPTFLAARYIAKNPEKFGFFVEKDAPITFDTVHVSESIDLGVIADLVDTTYKAIRELNPAILRWVTPPDVRDWVLYLPEGTKEKFKEGYKKIPESQKRHYVRHKVRYGETLSHLSYRYGVPIWLIKRTNHLRSNLIRVGQNLIIPVPKYKKAYYSTISTRKVVHRKKRKLPVEKGKVKLTYLVKEGDNLFDISRKYGVTVSKLRYWNGLQYRRYIYPGQKLYIWVPEEFAKIKQSPEENASNALALADHSKNQKEDSGKQKIIHIVKSGDTLWEIAKKYKISITSIKKWNNKKTNKIKPGEELVIYR